MSKKYQGVEIPAFKLHQPLEDSECMWAMAVTFVGFWVDSVFSKWTAASAAVNFDTELSSKTKDAFLIRNTLGILRHAKVCSIPQAGNICDDLRCHLCTPQNVIEPPCIIIRLLDYYTVASSKYVNKDKSTWNRSDLSECVSVVWVIERGDSHGFSLPSLSGFRRTRWSQKEASPISGACYAATLLPGLEGVSALPMQPKGFKRVRTSEHELFFTCQSRIHGETHFLKERFSSHISLIQIQLRGYCSWKYRPQRTQIPKTKNINWPQAFWWASTGQEVLWTLKCQTPCFTESLSAGQLVATCLFLGWIVPPASAAAALRCELPELPTSNSDWC